jgi:hypothetical protein
MPTLAALGRLSETYEVPTSGEPVANNNGRPESRRLRPAAANVQVTARTNGARSTVDGDGDVSELGVRVSARLIA